MPLPNPNKGEQQGDFIGRCISQLSHKNEGESSAQRSAICYSQWRKSKSSIKLSAEEVEAIKRLLEPYVS